MATRNILYTLTASLFFQLGMAQERIVFPKLDAALLELWHQAELGYTKDCPDLIDQIDDLWIDVQDSLERLSSYTDLEGLVHNVSALVQDLPGLCDDAAEIQLAEHLYQIIWEFRVTRFYRHIEDYPVDALWDLYDIYNEIHMVVHDDMLGLLDWNELSSRVEIMTQFWVTYRDLVENDYTATFGPTEMGLAGNLEEFAQAMDLFIASFETAQQSAFEDGCDQLGTKLKWLLHMQSELLSPSYESLLGYIQF